ncbi:neuronal acetylcholine receptor subunit alpha-7-like [Asterias amurensis]|uniref:neuronal acetylcholine receptor subunit alpha-7-like n=1 Tax=Asterias amurensis TaxID=7602 RepID=UPI003AB45DE3
MAGRWSAGIGMTGWIIYLGLLIFTECHVPRRCLRKNCRGDLSEESEGLREVELFRTLLNESAYPEHSRPSKNPSIPTVVKFGLELNAVIDMDEPSQVIKTQVSIILSWTDSYLTWDQDYYGVPEVRIPSSKMWMPDITLLNSADSANFMLENRLVRVKPSGETEWRAFVVLTSFCKINFSFFPYDEQTCLLRFRAWTYTIEHVIFALGSEFNADDAEEHGEWHIVNMERNITETIEDHGNFSDITVAISLSRRPQFYVMNIIVPCLIIYCLTLFSFCLPCDSGEKIGLGITILLSLTVFMLISADMMPPTSDNFPLIGQFYTSTMVLVAASVGMSVMVLNFNHRPPSARRAPAWMRRLLLHSRCSRIISLTGRQSFDMMRSSSDSNPHSGEVTYMLPPSAKTTKSSCLSEEYSATDHILTDTPSHQDDNGGIGMVRYPSSPKLGRNTATLERGEQETSLTKRTDSGGESPGSARQGRVAERDANPVGNSSALEKLLINISGDLRKLVVRKEADEEEQEIVDEWKLLAKAVDRICLIVFVLSSLILTVVLGSEMMRRNVE